MILTYAKLNVGREVLDALVGEERAVDEGGCDDALLAAEAAEERVGELGTGVRHRERGRSSAVLGLHDLVSTKLDAVDEFLVHLARDALAMPGLGKERDDGGARVATDDGDGRVLRGRTRDL